MEGIIAYLFFYFGWKCIKWITPKQVKTHAIMVKLYKVKKKIDNQCDIDWYCHIGTVIVIGNLIRFITGNSWTGFK